MIKFNDYQNARLDITLAFFRYNELEPDELVNSNIKTDVDELFKKWGMVDVVSKTQKELVSVFRILKNEKYTVTEENECVIYQKCLAGLLGIIEAKCTFEMMCRVEKISYEISKGQNFYLKNHFGIE